MANTRSMGAVPDLGATPAPADLVWVWDDSAGIMATRAYSDCVDDLVASMEAVIAGRTTDPGVAGQLWNDSGTVKVSAG